MLEALKILLDVLKNMNFEGLLDLSDFYQEEALLLAKTVVPKRIMFQKKNILHLERDSIIESWLPPKQHLCASSLQGCIIH